MLKTFCELFRNYFLYGEPPFKWFDVQAWLPDYAAECASCLFLLWT